MIDKYGKLPSKFGKAFWLTVVLTYAYFAYVKEKFHDMLRREKNDR